MGAPAPGVAFAHRSPAPAPHLLFRFLRSKTKLGGPARRRCLKAVPGTSLYLVPLNELLCEDMVEPFAEIIDHLLPLRFVEDLVVEAIVSMEGDVTATDALREFMGGFRVTDKIASTLEDEAGNRNPFCKSERFRHRLSQGDGTSGGQDPRDKRILPIRLDDLRIAAELAWIDPIRDRCCRKQSGQPFGNCDLQFWRLLGQSKRR